MCYQSAHPLLLLCNIIIPSFQLSNLYKCIKETLLNRFILTTESRVGICNSPNRDIVIRVVQFIMLARPGLLLCNCF